MDDTLKLLFTSELVILVHVLIVSILWQASLV